MKNLFKEIDRKINEVVLTLITTGLFLLILSVLVVWTDFVLELLIGLIILSVAYIFFYLAYKFWLIKKTINKFIK